PRARNQDVFAEHRKRQSGVYCVPKRVEDGCDLAIDQWVMFPDVAHRQRNVLGKSARSIHAYALRMRAQMPAPGKAVAAAAAHHMPFPAHHFARVKVVYVRANIYDLASKLVPNCHRDRNRCARPLVPFIYMEVGAANTGMADPDENVIDPDRRLWYIFQPKTRLTFTFHQSLHARLHFPKRTGRISPVVRVSSKRTGRLVPVVRDLSKRTGRLVPVVRDLSKRTGRLVPVVRDLS